MSTVLGNYVLPVSHTVYGTLFLSPNAKKVYMLNHWSRKSCFNRAYNDSPTLWCAVGGSLSNLHHISTMWFIKACRKLMVKLNSIYIGLGPT